MPGTSILIETPAEAGSGYVDAAPPGTSIMSACPVDSDLLRFLDGELAADADARIVAHIEDCVACQASLERLTGGTGALGSGEPIETVEGSSEARKDLDGTEVIGDELGREASIGPIIRLDSTLLGKGVFSRIEDKSAYGETGSFDLGPLADHDQVTDDSRLEVEHVDKPNEVKSTVDLNEVAPQAVVRKRPAHGWPTVPGYQILQRLGEGGMGVVYKARQLGLKRLVALKMIRGGSQARAEHLSRFRVEAEAVARLRHPNIIQIYDIGESEGLPYVALELLDGDGLAERLAGNPQPARQSAELMITLAMAVHVAHLADIVHRDLKPSNVLYSTDGVPKITDFGLAKQMDSDVGQTESGQIMGSPSYMAPEQARGHSHRVGPACDVYALGAILYEMLTGRPPFKGETPYETVRQVIDDDPVAPSQLVPRVPRDLETICLKCLQKEPARRYGSAEALAGDLTRYLSQEPILARRTGMFERAVKWARRRPIRALTLVSVSAAILVAFMSAVEWQRRQNERVLQDQAHLMRQQEEGTKRLLSARDQVSKNKLNDAEVTLTALKENIQKEVRLGALRNSVEELLKEIKQRQAVDQTRQSDRLRYANFLHLYDNALFHDTHFIELDLSDGPEATRRAAREALTLYAADTSSDRWSLGPMPVSLSQAEQAAIREHCYVLLLILAEAETNAETGLRRLDEAARLRPPSRAYHLRRAICLSRIGEKSSASQERSAADALKPSTAFDHFLAGQERFARRDFVEANQEFDTSLLIQPDQFWAQALSAICFLQLKKPVEAKALLNASLQREKEFAWLYILRAYASGQVAANTQEQVERRIAPGVRDEVDRLFAAADKDYGTAITLLDRIPNNELRYAALVNRSVLRLELGRDLGEAVGYLQAAIQLRPKKLPAQAALAKVFQSQGKPEEAVEQFSQAIALSPRTAALYRDRAGVDLNRAQSTPAQRARSLADIEQAIRLEAPANPVLSRDHFHRAQLLSVDHRDAEALSACDAALQIDSNYGDAHRLRIESLLRLKRHDDVVRSCDPLIARGKATSAIYQLRGLAREEKKDYAGAIEDCTNAMLFGGNRAMLLRRRGWLYIVADAPQLALHDFEGAIRLDAMNGDAFNGRGYARLRLGEHRQAVADAERALSVGEPKADLYYKAARVYAVAAVAAAAEVRRKGQETVALVSRYQDRATDLISEAMKRLPADRRESFLKEVILVDPQLRTLRRRIATLNLTGFVPSTSRSTSKSAQ